MVKVIFECPAYVVHESIKHYRHNSLIQLKHGTKLSCADFGSLRKQFTAGSIMGCGRDDLMPGDTIADYIERDIAKGGGEHWINANMVSLVAGKREQERYMNISVGDRVLFEGKTYTVEKRPNDNLGLKPFDYLAEQEQEDVA